MAKREKPVKRKVSYGLRERAWWVMRRRQKFTLSELLNVVGDGSERDGLSNLRKYCNALAKAGILKLSDTRRAGSALTSNGSFEYRLVINSGRKNPVWRDRFKEVYDPNTDITYSIAEGVHDE
ncbi:MAG TPA: hypothetical protein DCG63_03920 [Methylophilaceae bacterium]|nr:hypothetical protein [Methylophilaceae bacterium]